MIEAKYGALGRLSGKYPAGLWGNARAGRAGGAVASLDEGCPGWGESPFRNQTTVSAIAAKWQTLPASTKACQTAWL